MNPDYFNSQYEEDKYRRQQYEREKHERSIQERERNSSASYSREREMLEHIAYLEEKCKMLQRYSGLSNEEILYNMDITVIEKYLRRKKLENLNNL